MSRSVTILENAVIRPLLDGLEGRWRVTYIAEDESPWLIVRVERTEPYETSERGAPEEYAMWRATRDIYPMVNGRVEGDPISFA